VLAIPRKGYADTVGRGYRARPMTAADRPLAVLLAATSALLLAAGAASAQTAAAWKSCGTVTSTGTPLSVKAKGISCNAARAYVADGAPAGWQCAADAIVCWRGAARSLPETAPQAYEAFPVRQYFGTLDGALGAGHHFYVGDGLYLTFSAPVTAPVRYRVCWGLAGHAPTRCASGSVPTKVSKSKIFVAPQVVGNWVARWYVAGRQVASWAWYQDYGD
jgi:hypothetical protein